MRLFLPAGLPEAKGQLFVRDCSRWMQCWGSLVTQGHPSTNTYTTCLPYHLAIALWPWVHQPRHGTAAPYEIGCLRVEANSSTVTGISIQLAISLSWESVCAGARMLSTVFFIIQRPPYMMYLVHIVPVQSLVAELG